MRKGGDLEQLAHGIAIVTDQTRQRLVDFGGAGGLCLQRRCTVLDAEAPQKLRLLDRAETDCTHRLDGPRKRLEVDVRGQIETPGKSKGVSKSVLAHSLQSLAKTRLGVTVVDHQGGASVICDAATELHSHSIGAPLKNRTRAWRAQGRRKQCLEKRNWFGRDSEGELAGGINLNAAFVPSSFGLYRLIDRQGIKELVGENNRGSFRHLGKGRVPESRNACDFERFLLLRLQSRADLDKVNHQGGAEIRHDLDHAQRVLHHGAAPGTQLDQTNIFRLAHLFPNGSGP